MKYGYSDTYTDEYTREAPLTGLLPRPDQVFEAAFFSNDDGLIWTNLSDYVELNEGIKAARRRQTVFDDVAPATFGITLDNSAGTFNNDKADSPFTGKVSLDVPLRFRLRWPSVSNGDTRNLLGDTQSTASSTDGFTAEQGVISADVNLDAQPIGFDDASAAYTGTWGVYPYPNTSSNTAGSTLAFTFSGTDVQWIGYQGPDRGKAQVSVDGAAPITIDCYATVGLHGITLYHASGLLPGVHTMTINVLGTHSLGSSDSWVTVESFLVSSVATPPGGQSGDIIWNTGVLDQTGVGVMTGRGATRSPDDHPVYVKPNTPYNGKVLAKCDPNGIGIGFKASLRLRWFDINGAQISESVSEPVPLSAGYAPITVTGVSPANAHTMRLGLFNETTVGPVARSIAFTGGDQRNQLNAQRNFVIIPTTASVGDTALLWIRLGNRNCTVSSPYGIPPAGWTLVNTAWMDSAGKTFLYRKTITAADINSRTYWTASAKCKQIALLACYAGTNQASPVHLQAETTEGTYRLTHATPSVTTTLANCWIHSAVFDVSTTTTVWGAPGGANVRAYQYTTGGNAPTGICSDDGTAHGTGATAAQTFTANASSRAATMHTVALAPATGTGPGSVTVQAGAWQLAELTSSDPGPREYRFDSGIGSWRLHSGTATVSWDNAQGYTTVGSLKALTTGTASTTVKASDDSTAAGRFPCIAGQVVPVTARIKSSVSRSVTLFLRFWDAGGTVVGSYSSSPVTSSTSSWSALTHSATAPAGAVTYMVMVIISSSTIGESHWVDDVVISTPVPWQPGGHWESLFTGSADSWQETFQGDLTLMEVQATDRTKQLASITVGSAVYETIRRQDPIAYYKLDESAPSGSTVQEAANSADVSQPTLTQTSFGTGLGANDEAPLSWGSGTGPGTDGSSALILNPIDKSNGLGLVCNLANPISNAIEVTLIQWWNSSMTDASTTHTIIKVADAIAGTSKRVYLEIRGTPGVSIQANALIASEAASYQATATASGQYFDGKTHMLAATFQVLGGQLVSTIYIDGAQEAQATTATSLSQFPLLKAFGVGTAITSPFLCAGTFSNAVVLADALDADTIADIWDAGSTGFAGDTITERIARLCDWEGQDGLDLDDSDTILDRHMPDSQSLSSAIQQAAKSGAGTAYINGDGKIAFLSRETKELTRSPQPVLDATDVGKSFSKTTDDTLLINKPIVKRLGSGVTTTMPDQDSIDLHQVHDKEFDTLLSSDGDAKNYATYIRAFYGDPQPRCDSVTVDALILQEWADVIGIGMWQILRILNLPSVEQNPDLDLYIEGWEIVINPSSWVIAFDTSTAIPFAILDDPERGVVGRAVVGW